MQIWIPIQIRIRVRTGSGLGSGSGFGSGSGSRSGSIRILDLDLHLDLDLDLDLRSRSRSYPDLDPDPDLDPYDGSMSRVFFWSTLPFVGSIWGNLGYLFVSRRHLFEPEEQPGVPKRPHAAKKYSRKVPGFTFEGAGD